MSDDEEAHRLGRMTDPKTWQDLNFTSDEVMALAENIKIVDLNNLRRYNEGTQFQLMQEMWGSMNIARGIKLQFESFILNSQDMEW